jgi:putative membrane protein
MVTLALGVGYVVVIRLLGPTHAGGGPLCTRRQIACVVAGLVALGAALTWPVVDLARRWSLLVHMVQLSLIVLVATPLLLLGLPRWLVGLVTRPVGVDSFLRRLTSPLIATLVFNAVVITSLLPPVMKLTSGSQALSALMDLALFVAAVIMWTPALRLLPGPPQLSSAGRVGYLFVQSILPNFPALVFIFAHRPIYSSFSHGARLALGISALADQQLAGVVAKMVGICILWGAAAAILVRTQRAEESGIDPDPLTWDDVERELRRLERRPRRSDAG